MKRKYIFLAVICFIIISIGVPVIALQQTTDVQHQDTLYVDSSIIKGNNFFGAGKNVEFAGRALRDVVVAGQDVLISGPVEGNVIVFGENVRITGDVEGNVFAAGGSIQIDSRVNQNVYLAAENVVIAETAQVGWSVIAAASSLDIRGHVRENVRAGTGSLTINGQIEGGVTVALRGDDGKILLLPRTIIGGDIQYQSNIPLEQRAGAIIRGAVHFTELQEVHRSSFPARMIIRILFLINLLFVSFIVVRFVPKICHHCQEDARDYIPHALGAGLFGGIIIPIGIGLLLVSGIGVYTALLVGLLFVGMITISLPIAGSVFGHWIVKGVLKRRLPLWAETGIGVIGVVIVGWIPIVGLITLTTSLIFGFGILILQMLRSAHMLRIHHHLM